MILFFFFKQKTAYEMRISDWSSDVCSSDLFATIGNHRIISGQFILELFFTAFFYPQHFVDLPPHRIPILKMNADIRPFGQAAKPLPEKVFLLFFRANILQCAKLTDILWGVVALIVRHVPISFQSLLPQRLVRLDVRLVCKEC